MEPFTKIEKMTTKKYKPPRMIQARHITFNISYGCFIKPLEEHVFKGPLKHHFGKGNYDEQARRIIKCKQMYKYFTELDHDSFDAHITQQMLSLTHKFYLACYRHNKELRELTKRTLVNFCRSRQGDKYIVTGTRMSGDVDTSLGNSLINYAIIKHMLELMGLDGEVIVNGDDSIIFTNEPINISVAVAILKTMNMNSKMKPSVTNIHQVEFCQSKIVMKNDGQYTMMMNPERLYTKFGMTYKNLPFKQYQLYLNELIYCLAFSHINTPVGYAWLSLLDEQLIDAIKKKQILTPKKMKYIEKSIFLVMERENKSEVCDNEITHSMYEAYPELDEILVKI